MRVSVFSIKAAISTCLVSMLLMPLPTLAALTAIDGARLDQFEKTVFGSPRKTLTEEARLRALETNLFGKAKSGASKGRLDAVAKLINPADSSGKPDYLPPMAAQMDSSVFSQAGAPVTTRSATAEYASTPAHSLRTASVDRTKDLLRQALQKHSQGDVGAAQKLFKQVLSLDNGNADANFNLGAMAEDSGDLTGAQRYYKAAAARNPNDLEIQDALASIDGKISQQHQARATASQLENKSKLRQVAQEAAAAYKAGRYDQAISLLESIDRQAPGDANVKYGLGQAYRGKGDLQRANQNLQAAAALDPQNPLYRNSLSELAQQQQQQQQQQVASQPALPNAYGDTLPSGARDYGQPQVSSDFGQPGQLTPFSGDERLYGRASGGGFGGIGGGIGSALGIGGLGAGLGGLMGGNRALSSSSGRGTRMVRGAVTGSLAGAATGAITGMMRGSGGVKSGAVKGAMYGGLFGLLSSF